MRLPSQVLLALFFGTKQHWHILVAIVFGIVLGILFPGYGFLHQFFDFVGQVFIRLITMLVIPLVVSSLVVGISSIKDARQIGRMGFKAFMLFMLLMGIAAVIGGGLSLVLQPGFTLQSVIAQGKPLTGHILHNPAQCTQEFQSLIQGYLTQKQPMQAVLADASRLSQQCTEISNSSKDFWQLFLNMIPKNPLESLVNMDLIPAILFTIFLGAAIALIGPAGKPLLTLFESLFTVTMKMVDWVMVLAVPGVFSLAFVTVAKAGPDIFIKLAPFALVMILGLLIQALIVLPLFLRFMARIDFAKLYNAISAAIMIAFGTASSSATLPITVACCERRGGISNRIASFVLPTGASINKTGTTMFEVAAVMFLAQAYGIPLDIFNILWIMGLSIIASIGSAGIPSGGLFTMSIVLQGMGNFDITTFSAGVAMIWSIDRALDMCRTVVNVMSSCSVAAIVAASEGELNRDILNNPSEWKEVV